LVTNIGRTVITTYRFRIKDSGRAHVQLQKMASSVNFVWNFCKQTQKDALRSIPFKIITDSKTKKTLQIVNFLTKYEMNNLVSGSSKELNLHSQTIQAVAEEYVTRRTKSKKLLRWRGKKKLGWVPEKASGIKFFGTRVKYCGHEFKLWNSYKIAKGIINKEKYKDYDSRGLPSDAVIKTGSFSNDKRGRWYLNLTFESQKIEIEREDSKQIGIDIGIKTLATCSDGEKIERPNLRKSSLIRIKRLKKCQKFSQRRQSKTKKYFPLPKLKQEKNLHAKIANTRKDYLHKESLKIVKNASLIVVGDVPCKLMNRSKTLAGISYDSGIGMFKSMLSYKAVRAGGIYKEFSERNSTRTCSKCRVQRQRIGLGIRIWICEKCASVHDRDTNAAINILHAYQTEFGMGHHTLICTQNNTS